MANKISDENLQNKDEIQPGKDKIGEDDCSIPLDDLSDRKSGKQKSKPLPVAGGYTIRGAPNHS